MMTPQKINEAVARKLGLWISDGPHSKIGPTFTKDIPDYCTSIAAAWEIAEKIKNTTLFEILWHDGQWECQIASSEVTTVNATADTAPMAICLAYLKI